MFEVFILTQSGWQPLACHCPAGRAAFTTEQAANQAMQAHLSNCLDAAGASVPPASRAFRAFATEAA